MARPKPPENEKKLRNRARMRRLRSDEKYRDAEKARRRELKATDTRNNTVEKGQSKGPLLPIIPNNFHINTETVAISTYSNRTSTDPSGIASTSATLRSHSISLRQRIRNELYKYFNAHPQIPQVPSVSFKDRYSELVRQGKRRADPNISNTENDYISDVIEIQTLAVRLSKIYMVIAPPTSTNQNTTSITTAGTSGRSKLKRKRKQLDDPENQRRKRHERYMKRKSNKQIDQLSQRLSYMTITDTQIEHIEHRQTQNATTGTTQQTSHSAEHIIAQFERQIRQGPTEICCCCGGTWFPEQMKSLNKAQILAKGASPEFISQVFVLDPQLDLNNFCNTCFLDVRKGRIPTLCLSNGFKYPPIPECLSRLNRIEERLVAPRHIFQSIWTVAGVHGQFKHRGAVINVPVNVDTTVTQLPRPLSDSNIIPVKLAKKMSYARDYMEGNVNVNNVWDAIMYLVNSESYRRNNITVNPNWLRSFDEGHITEDDYDDPDTSDDNDMEDTENGNKGISEEDIPVGGAETLYTGFEGIRMAPGDGVIPLSLLTDEDNEALAFPTIFCGEGLHPKSYENPVTYGNYCKALLRHHDRRAVRTDFLFYLDTKRLLKALASKVSIMLRMSNSNSTTITASQALNDEHLRTLINTDTAFRVFDNIRGSPVYWKKEKSDVMAMIRQLGIPTLFITLSAAESKWPELLVILKKVLDHVDITEEEASNLPSQEVARLIQSDAPTCARYFDRRFRLLRSTWKPPHGPFGSYTMSDYYYRVEFQARGSPHVHMMAWLKDAPIYSPDFNNEQQVCSFIDSLMSSKSHIPDDPVLTDLVNSRQRHNHTHTCWDKGVNRGLKICRFGIPFFPMDKTRIIHPFIDHGDLTEEEVSQRKAHAETAKRIRRYLDDNVSHLQNSDMQFDDFLSVLQLTLNDYLDSIRSTLSRPKIMLKRNVRDILINNYNPRILKMQRSNIDLQYILDPYACCVYVVDYINKSDKGMSRVLQNVLSESIQEGAPTKRIFRNLASKYYNLNEVSAQEASYNLLQLNIVQSSTVSVFIPTGPEQTRARLLKPRSLLETLSPDSTNIYQKGLVEYYQLRPDSLNNLNLAQYSAWYQYSSKRTNSSETRGTAANEVCDDNDNTSDSTWLKLKNNAGFIRKRRKAKILKFHIPHEDIDLANFHYSMVMLYLPWRNQSTDLDDVDCSAIYQSNYDLIQQHRSEFTKMSDQVISDNIAELEARNNNLDSVADTHDDSDGEPIRGDDSNDFRMYSLGEESADLLAVATRNSERTATRRTDPITPTAERYVRPDRLDDLEYQSLVASLNPEQRDCFNHVIDHVRHNSNGNPLHLFVTGGAGTGKSLLIKALYQGLTRFYDTQHSRDLLKPSVLLCAFTGKAAFNIGGQTIHSLFHLPVNRDDITTLSHDVSNTLAVELAELKVVIIDEISMISGKQLLWIDKRLQDIFNNTSHFGGIHVLVFGDFLQLPPVRGGTIYSGFPSNPARHLRLMDIWHSFKVHKLTQIMRQRDDALFAAALNNMARGTMTSEDLLLFQSRTFPAPPAELYTLRNLVRLYPTNALVDMCNSQAINSMSTEYHVSKAHDKLAGQGGNFQQRSSLLQYAANPSLPYHKTGGLVRELRLQLEARYMITVNIDTSDGLVNGSTGYLKKVDLGVSRDSDATDMKPLRIWLELEDERSGRKQRTKFRTVAERKRYPLNWTPIEPTMVTFQVGNNSQLMIARTQFPVVIAEAITIHKSQGATFANVMVDLSQGRVPNRSSLYVACSRATSASGLFIIKQTPFTGTSPLAASEPISVELERLNTCQLIPTFSHLHTPQRQFFQLISHNVQSLSAHVNQIVNDQVYLCSDILLFNETWSTARDTYDIPEDIFVEIARVDVEGERPSPYGAICYLSRGLLSRLGAYTVQQHLWKNERGSISIAGFTSAALSVFSCYMSPRCNIENGLRYIEEALASSSGKIILAGDFNINFQEDSQRRRQLYELLAKYRMASVMPQTFTSTTENGTCIDNIFTNFNSPESGRYISHTSYHDPLYIHFTL